MEVQKSSRLISKTKIDLRVELLRAIIQRKDVIVFEDGHSFEEMAFDEEQQNKKRKLEKTNSSRGNFEMMETE